MRNPVVTIAGAMPEPRPVACLRRGRKAIPVPADAPGRGLWRGGVGGGDAKVLYAGKSPGQRLRRFCGKELGRRGGDQGPQSGATMLPSRRGVLCRGWRVVPRLACGIESPVRPQHPRNRTPRPAGGISAMGQKRTQKAC
jgi:hypothetical protein